MSAYKTHLTPAAGQEGLPTEVSGVLSQNWPLFDRPAVILNPDARPCDLLAWCWAEIAMLRDIADATGGDSENADLVVAHYTLRLGPLERVMRLAMDNLHEQEKKR